MDKRVGSQSGLSSERRELLVLIILLLLATVLRVAWPTVTEFKFSEARLEALALELTREGRIPLVGVPSSAGFDHSPISVYLYVPLFLFTTDPVPATVFGGLVGVASVWLCWSLSRRWLGGGRYAAFVATLLFATSPWAVSFSRKIWQVVFVPFFALAVVGLLVSALVGKRRWNLAWALVILALLVQIHPSAVWLAVTAAGWLIIFRREVRLTPLLVGIGLAALTAIPFLLHQVNNGWPALHAIRSLPAAEWTFSAVALAWEAISGRSIYVLAGQAYPLLKFVPQLGSIFNLVGWLTFGSAGWLSWRLVGSWRDKEPAAQQAARIDLILLSWLVMPVVFNFHPSLPMHLHFFSLVTPAAFLIIGRAWQDIFDGRKGAWSSLLEIGSFVALALLVLCQVFAWAYMGRFVTTHDTTGGFGSPLRRYVEIADRAVALADVQGSSEILVVGQGASVVTDPMPAIFDVLLRDRASYRFVDGESTAVFPAHRALALLTPDAGSASRWYLTDAALQVEPLSGGFQAVGLSGAMPHLGFMDITGPRLFENGIEAQGYLWEGDTVLESRTRLWLQWQILWHNSQDSHLYARVVDANNGTWGQTDIAGYPIEYRRKGDRIVNLFDINAHSERSGFAYAGEVGVYTYPDVVAVPVIDDAGKPVSDVVLLVR